VRKIFKKVKMARALTHVLVLDIPPRLALQFGHVLGFTGEVLNKHLL
jgi:hypothetical protein